MKVQFGRRQKQRTMMFGVLGALVVGVIGGYWVQSVSNTSAVRYFEPSTSIALSGTEEGTDNPFVVTTDADGSVYTAQGSDTPKVYRYDSNQTLTLSYEVDRCTNISSEDPLYVLDIAVDSQGAMYVATSSSQATPSLTAVSCIQKYDVDGVHVGAFNDESYIEGSYFGSLAISPAGVLYAYDYKAPQIYAFDSDGVTLNTFGSLGTGNGQLGQQIYSQGLSGMAYYNNHLYVLDEPNYRVQLFDASGEYQSKFALHANLIQVNGLSIDSTGIYMGEYEKVRRYTHAGQSEMLYNQPNWGAGHINDVSASGNLLYVVVKGTAEHEVYSSSAVEVGAPLAPVVEISDITDTSAKVTFSMNPSEPVVVPMTYSLKYEPIENPYATSLGTVSGALELEGATERTLTNLNSGTKFKITLSYTSMGGTSETSIATFQTTGNPYTDALITSIEETTFEGYRALHISGENFVNSGMEVFTLLLPFVTVDGEQVAGCSIHSGMTAAEIVGMLPSAVASDTPRCYMIYADGGGTLLSATEVYVLVNEDQTVSGSYSVGGSAPFVYSSPEEEDESQEMTAGIGNQTLHNGMNITNRPTFSGKAPAGSTVVVTVHSDPVTCTTTADSQGNWTCTLPTDLPAGAHTVYVEVTTPGGGVYNLGPFNVTSGEVQGVLAPNTGIAPRLSQEAQASTSAQSVHVGELLIWAIAGASITGGLAYTLLRKKNS